MERVRVVGPSVVVIATLVASLFALEGTRPSRVAACAVFSRDRTVRISGEEAVIVWDAASQTQHFIRTAAFEGASADFGFVVPTPSRPELAEVDDGIFARLYQLYRRPPPALPQSAGGGALRGVRSAAHPPVVVLERRTVAGLDTAVLAASDAGALDRWLAQHGYQSGPEQSAWLRPYVERRWIVTAFRIDPGQTRSAFGTRAVRMSFHTDRPFFPYSEPRAAAGAASSPRPFRVSLIAPTRMRVRRGTPSWSGRVGFAARPGAALVGAVGGAVPGGIVSASSWLTVFDEPRSVRGSDDLFFERDGTQAAMPSVITTALTPGAGGLDVPEL